MYGCFLVPPDDDGADLGVLFWHKDGYSTACGHGTIALGAWAVESGRVAAPRRRRGRRDDRRAVGPRASRACAARRRRRERRLPQRAVVRRRARRATAAGVAVDVAYGGAIYASVPAARFGLRVVPERPARADRRRARGQGGARGHRRRAPPRRRAPVGHLRDDPLRATLGDPAPAQRDDLRRRRGRSLAVRLGDLGALRAAGRRRAPRRGRRPAPRLDRRLDLPRRAWSGGRPTACSPRSRGRPTAPASTASCSTRATRWAPASSCDEPALPRRGRRRRAPDARRPRSTRSRPRWWPAWTPRPTRRAARSRSAPASCS